MSYSFGNSTTPLLVLIGSAILTYLVVRSMFGHDPHEPPLVPSSIPLVGHLVGLSRSSFNYYTELRAVTDCRWSRTPPCAPALHPGPALDDINRAMLAEINQSLDDLAPTDGIKRFGLFAWLRDNLNLATTRAVHGPLNPFDDKETCDAFWEFEAGLVQILVGLLPSITARKPVAARTKAAQAFEKYYKAGGIDKASAYARNRHEVEAKTNFPAEDMARSSVGGTIALLVNTVPSVFWALLHLHAHPGLLGQVRDEGDGCTSTDGATKTIDMASLKEKCPLLLSAYQEVLRYRAMGASVREVMEDTQLGGFLLKKGAMLQMPSHVIHTDESLWGTTEYDPRRFLESEKDSRPRDVCFRAFGGGKTLCPGRHFATNEILAVVALWIARFDIRPVDGEWKMPTTAKTNVAAAVMGPDEDVQVEIATREGMGRVRWQVKLEASGKTFAIVTEDVGEREE
ncbi:25-hydroxycholesterol 7-alpha-hydroxylase [Cytospora mali]|uniref:25-hydroxycholesterol 7-alpha-hydroxylase n=1 Tax=Cytospora mali TaxID=578113 RepID=A0A194VX13_CYTMA|nr:25-hydroxycholesterol 7-alpha-hydroxylase [Valsa mali]